MTKPYRIRDHAPANCGNHRTDPIRELCLPHIVIVPGRIGRFYIVHRFDEIINLYRNHDCQIRNNDGKSINQMLDTVDPDLGYKIRHR